MIPRRITVVSLAVATSLLGDATLYTVLPTHAEQLGIRLALVGILLSANRFVRLFSNSWAGHIHDRFHSPWPFVMALLLGACTTAIYGLLWGFWTFLIARLLWGVCWSFLRSEGYTAVIIEASPDNRGRLMGMYKLIAHSGMMVGGFLGGVLTETIGYRNCLLLFASLSLLGAFAMFLEQSRSERNQSDKTAGAEHNTPIKAYEDIDTHTRPDKRTQIPELWMIYLLGFTNILVTGSVIGSTAGRLLKVRFGMTIPILRASVGVASVTGVLMLVRRAMSLLLTPVFGHLADRVGRRFVLVLGLTVSMISLLCLATQHNLIMISLAVVAGSTSGAAIFIALDASIADASSEHRHGQLVGRYVTFTDLGSACGPLISYLLLGAKVGIEWLYIGGFVLLTGVCALYGLRTRFA